jgi:hypothetical protein
VFYRESNEKKEENENKTKIKIKILKTPTRPLLCIFFLQSIIKKKN